MSFLHNRIFLKTVFKNTLSNLSVRCIFNMNVDLNIEYLCNPQNKEAIEQNITRRKGVGNIENVHKLYQKLQNKEGEADSSNIYEEFITEALKIPNETHKTVLNYENDPKLVKCIGEKPAFTYKPKEFYELNKNLNVLRTIQLGNVTGSRSYFFYGALAELEQALLKYTVNKLLKENFQFYSVPDLLHPDVIESCGMSTKGVRNQIYCLDHKPELCLSGTSEMAIAGYLKNKTIDVGTPLKIAAVSRCYRAETSSVVEERGIYRVHQFTKIEMFAATHPSESDEMLESFLKFQEQHFSVLGLHLQILDMPPHELGAPAYRKYDVEAWMPGRNMYGEVSSCSNCTDYQARRLNIKFNCKDGKAAHVHTINGTACAIPRMLIALVETYQNEDGTINIPTVLKPFLNFDKIIKDKRVPELKLKKIKR